MKIHHSQVVDSVFHDFLAHSFCQHFILVTGLIYKTFKYFFDPNVPFDKRVERFLK